MLWLIIGWSAVVLTALQFVPQVIKAFQSKRLTGVSLATFVLVSITASTWILHGIHQADSMIIIANTLVLISALSIVILKIARKH